MFEHPKKINCSCTNIPHSPDSSISEPVHFSINVPQPECQHFTLSKVESIENIDKRIYPSVKVLDADNSSLSDTSCGCDSPCKPSNSAKRACHCNQQLINYGYFNRCHSCGPSTPYTYSTQQHYEFDYQNFHQNTYEYQQLNVQKVTTDYSNALSVNVRSWSDSSINILEDRTTSIDLPPLNWNGYDCDPSCLTAAHTGKTLLINGNWCNGRPYIQGGPLSGTYIFSQIHFHTPSEHSLEGKRFPLEMHVVHYKTNYLTQERAMKEKDGTLVLVYLFDVSDCCEKTSFACIAEVAECLMKPHSTKDIPAMSLNNIMCPFFSNYYFYMGSVGAHKETYLLQVVVNCKVSEIPRNELKELLSILKSGSGSAHHLSKMRPQNDSIFHVGTEVEDVCASSSKPAATQRSKDTIIDEIICTKPNAHNSKKSQRRHRFRFNTVSAPSVCQSLDGNFSQTSVVCKTPREDWLERREARRERREANKRRKCLRRMTKMENRCRRQLRKREGFLGCKTKAKRQECLRYYIKTKKLQQRCSQHSKLGECTEECIKRELIRRQGEPTVRIGRDDRGKEVVWKNSKESCDLVVVESTTSRVECDEDSTSASASASTSQKQSADESSLDNDSLKGSIDKTRSIAESRKPVGKTVSIEEGRKLSDNVPKRDVKGSVERCTDTVCVRKRSNEDSCEGDFVRDVLMDDDDLEDEDFLTNPIFQDCVKAQMCRRRRARKKWRTKCSLCKSKRCRYKHCCTQKILPNDPVRAIDASPFTPAELKIIDKKEERKNLERRNLDRRESERRDLDRKQSDRRDVEKRESIRRDTDKRESDRRESERRDLDRKESDRRDLDRKESDRRDLDRREAERRDLDRREVDRRESERRDLDRREVHPRELDRREADRRDLDRRETDRRDLDRKESFRRDLDKREPDRRDFEKREAERKEAELREIERKEEEKRRKHEEKIEAHKREVEKREAERRYFEKLEADRLLEERREFDRKEYQLREAQRKEAERKQAEKMEALKKKAEKPKDKRSFWNFDIFRRLDKNKEKSKPQDPSNKKPVKTVSIVPPKKPQPQPQPHSVEKKVEPKKPAKDDDDVFGLDDVRPDKNDVIVHYMMSPNEQRDKDSNETDKNVTPSLGESSSSQSSFKKYETPPESLLDDPLRPSSKENRVTFNVNLDSGSKLKHEANKQNTELHPTKLLNKKDAILRNSFPPYFGDSFGSSNKNVLPTFTVTSKTNFIKESLVEKPPLISTGTQCSVNKIFCKRTSLAEKIASNREKGLFKTELEDKKECYIKLIKNPELKESLKQKDIDRLEETVINKTEADSSKSKKKRKYFVVDKIEKDHSTGKKILVGCFRTKEELIVIKEMAKEKINRKEMDAQKEKELERKESLCEREICIEKFDIEKKKSTDRKENFLSKLPSLKKVVVEDKEDFRKREFVLKNLDEQKIGILIKKECYGNKSDAVKKIRLERKESTDKSISSGRTVDVEQKESAPKKTVSWKSVAVDKIKSFGIREDSIEKESRLKKLESEQKKSLRHRDPSVKTAETEKRKRGDKRDFSLKRLDPEKIESLLKRTNSGRKEFSFGSAKREYSLKRVDSDKRKEIKVIKSPKVEEVPKKSVVKGTDIAFRKDDLEKKKGGIKVENLNKKEDFCLFEKRKSLGKRDSSVKRTDAENKKNIDKKDELSKRGEVAKMKDGEKKKSLFKRENSLKRKNSNKKTNVEEEKNTETKESKQNDKIKTKGKKKFNAEVSEDKEKDKDKTTHKKRSGDKTENIDLVKKYSDFDEEEENIANLNQILGAEEKEQIKSETSKETKICFERNQDFDEKEHLEILEYLKNQIEKADSTEMGKELDHNEIIEICEETERKPSLKKEEFIKESKSKNSKTRMSMADLKSIEKLIELSKNENIKAEEKTEIDNLGIKCKSIERKDSEKEDLVSTLGGKRLEKDNLATGSKTAERKETEKESFTKKSKRTEREELGKENFATANKSIERKRLENDNSATECKSTERRESEKENLATKSKSPERNNLENDNIVTKSKSTEKKELEKENLVKKSKSTERKNLENDNIVTKSKSMEKKELEKENLVKKSKSPERNNLENDNIVTKSKSTEKKELEKENLVKKSKSTERKNLENDNIVTKSKSMEKKELEKENLVKKSKSPERNNLENDNIVTKSKSTEKKELEKENVVKKCKSTERKELGKENLATKSKNTERKELEEESIATKSNSIERKGLEKENIAFKSKIPEKKELKKENLATESKSTERKKLENENLEIKGKSTEVKELEKNNFATKNKSVERKELEKENLVNAFNSSERKEKEKECLATAEKKELEKEYLATASKSTEEKEVEKENYFKEYENIKHEDHPVRKKTSNYNDDSNNEEDLRETGKVRSLVNVKKKFMNKINDFVRAQNNKCGYIKKKWDQDKVENIESKESIENKKIKSSKDLEGKNVVKKSQNLINGEELEKKKSSLSERAVNENSSELCSKKSVKDVEGIGKNYELQNRTSKTDERKEIDVTYKNLDKKQALSTTNTTDKKCDFGENADIGKSENSRKANDLDYAKNKDNVDTDIKIFVGKEVNEEQNNVNQSIKLNSAESKEKAECFGSTQDINKENAEYKAEEEVRYSSIHEKIDEEINEEEPIVAKVTKEEVVKKEVLKEDLDNVGSEKEEKNFKKMDEVELKMNQTQKANFEETAKAEKESEKSDCCVNSLFRAQIPSTSVSETSQTPKKSFSIKVLKPQKLISDLSQDSLDESFTKRSSCLSKMSMFHQEELEKNKTNDKKEIKVSNSCKGTLEAEKVSDVTLESRGNDEKDKQSPKPKTLENLDKDFYSNKSSLGESSDKEVRVLHKFRPKEKMKKTKAEKKEQIVEKVLEKIKNSEGDHPNLGEILGINKDNPKISVCEMEISDHSGTSSTTKEISQTEQSSKQFSAKNSVYSPPILDSKETSKTKLGLPFEKVDSQAAIIIIPIEVNSLSNIELLVVEKIKQSLQNVEKKEVKQSGEASENVIEKGSAELVAQEAANENKKEEEEKMREKEELSDGREGGSVKNCVVAPETPPNNETHVNEVDLENEYKFESNSYNRSLFEFPLFLLIFNSHSSNFLHFSHIYSSFFRLLTIF